MENRVKNVPYECAVFRNKEDTIALCVHCLIVTFIELKRFVVSLWQAMIEALSKRLCIITRDLRDLQLF